MTFRALAGWLLRTLALLALIVLGVRATAPLAQDQYLRLRDEGMPVGLIDLTIRGDKEVAALRFTRDCKKVTYDANQEAVQAIKLQMRLIESQIQREYGVAGRGTL